MEPIDFFTLAHKRSNAFISGGKGNKGRRDADDLRAAVVFSVAAIDIFFRVKIVDAVRKNRESKKFMWSGEAKKILQKEIAKQLFKEEYVKLDIKKKEAVDATLESNRPVIIRYLDDAVKNMSFQSINRIDDAIKIMGEKPEEVWGKIQSRQAQKIMSPRGVGRPKVNKRGPKLVYKTQVTKLFQRRNMIVHEADLNLQSRKHKGRERRIVYTTVKKWLDSTEQIIKKIDLTIK